MYAFVALLVFVHHWQAFNMMIYTGSEDRRHAVQVSSAMCTLHIARQYFSHGTTTAIVRSGLPSTVHFNNAQSSYYLMLTNFMTELGWTVVIHEANKFIRARSTAYAVNNYVLMLKTVEDMENIVGMLRQMRSWNPHANFFVYIDTDLGTNWRFVVQQFLQMLWQEFVINVTLMLPDTQLFVNKLVTWFPYARENQGEPHQIIEVAICQSSQINPLNANVFPLKIPSDLNDFPINVATYLWSPFVMHQNQNSLISQINLNDSIDIIEMNLTDGIEIQIFRIIADKMKLKPIFRVHLRDGWGDVTDNHQNGTGEATGMMKDLMARKADVAICTLRPDNVLHELFDYTVQYMQDELTWLVPNGEPQPQWHGLIQIFQGTVWLVSLALYICIVCIAYCINHLNYPIALGQPYRQGLTDIALKMLSMMIGISMPFKQRTYRERMIVFLWAMLCLNWYTAYTTSLISRLTTSTHGKKINTIEDVLTYGLNIGMSTATTYFFKSDTEIDRTIMQNYELCTITEPCIEQIVTESNYALATSRMHSEDIIASYRLPNGVTPIRILPVVIASPPIEMLLIKGYPLLPNFNRILLRLMETGLVSYWKNANITLMQRNVVDEPQPLSLFHLMGAFLALLVGLCLAAGALGIEIMAKYAYK